MPPATYISYMLGGDVAAPVPKLWEKSPRWVRTKFANETIADSKNVMMLRRQGNLPQYFFPTDDVRKDLLESSDHTDTDQELGPITYWHVKVGQKISRDAAWAYEQAPPSYPDLNHHITFSWFPKNKMDAWYEEDEEIFVHPRDPYSRIDVIRSTRHIKITIADEVIADTKAPYILFETGLPARFYLPREDIRLDLLQPSSTSSRCPYKGSASYWSVQVKNKHIPDIAWTYKDPLPEAHKVKGLIAFLHEAVDTLYVDDELLPKPTTPWTR